MAARTVDAMSSFDDLLTNATQWRDQVLTLAYHASKKLEEYRTEYSRIVHQSKPRRAKSRSICSIHSKDDLPRSATEQPPMVTTPPNPVDISPLEAGNRYIYAQANKKRKTGTSIRSGMSGPPKFRSRQMVVVYYDAFMQDQLTELVKSIGGCRNTLRKGKMSYVVSKGLRLPSLHRGIESGASVNPVLTNKSLKAQSTPKLPTTKDQVLTTEVTPDGEAAFLQADKRLETCQNTCETAAHQLLRDGDCKIELDTVLNNLDDLIVLAKSTHESLKAEEAQVGEAFNCSSSSNSVHTTSDSTLVEKASREYLSWNRKLSPGMDSDFPSTAKERPALSSFVSAPPPQTIEIEVDDDSDASSIEIDIRQYRRNRVPPRAQA